MEFHSFIYVGAFLPITALLYHLLKSHILRNILLSGASIVFYAYAVWWYVVPMFISAILDFVVGKRMGEVDRDDTKQKQRLLLISLTINIGMLCFFKYTTWVTGGFSDLLIYFGFVAASSASAFTLAVPLPPGISFYTFQTMSYTIDIYRGDFKPKKSLVDYLAFVTFFPQLIAGPIERASNLLPQISKYSFPKLEEWKSGLFLILFGLFLKIVLADNFGGLIDYILRYTETPDSQIPPGLGLVFAYAFGFQIYCDFSAYSNIARGSARLFGIQLSRNFLTPYFSRNPSEFWRRWHISLSSWLRDYLYVSLGGSRQGKMKTLRNLMITMLLGGLWHGAGILFIVWGFIHGALLVIYRIIPIDVILEKRLGKFGVFLSIIIFYHFVCFAWIFFRATPEQLGPLFDSIITFFPAIIDRLSGVIDTFLLLTNEKWVEVTPSPILSILESVAKQLLVSNWLSFLGFWGLFIFTVPLMILDYIGYRKNVEFPDIWNGLNAITQAIFVVVLFYGIVLFGRRDGNEFIYFAF